MLATRDCDNQSTAKPPAASMPSSLLLLVLVYGAVVEAAKAGRELCAALEKRSSPDHNTSEEDVFAAQATFEDKLFQFARDKGWSPAPTCPATEPNAKKQRTGSDASETKIIKAEWAILASLRSVAAIADPTTAQGKSFLRMVGMVSGAIRSLRAPLLCLRLREPLHS